MTPARLITKKLFASALQCAKRLYLEYHEPDSIPKPSGGQEVSRQAGRRLVEIAREAFPGGETIAEEEPDAAVEATRAALSRDGPALLFDPAFASEGLLVRCDIVVSPTKGVIEIFEVKSGARIKTRHLNDVALQMHVAEASGFEVRAVSILHINPRYRHGGGNKYPVQELFKSVDVTQRVRQRADRVLEQLQRTRATLDDPSMLELPTGTWCRVPSPCPYLERCLAEGSKEPLLYLPGLNPEQEKDYHAEGIEDLSQLDAERPGLTLQQRRALESHRTKKLIVEADLFEELTDLAPPLHFVDIASLLQILPSTAGSRPWQRIPWQWSACTLRADGSIEAKSFLAEDGSEPREDFIRTLADHVNKEGTLFFYHAFSETMLRQMLEDVPAEKPRVRAVLNMPRITLQLLIEDAAYHPDFKASFTMASVFGALVDGGSRKPAIATKDEASTALERLQNPRTRATTRKKLRAQLEEHGSYCAQAMLAIYRVLQEARA